MGMMTDEQYARDLTAMIESDVKRLAEHLAKGDRVIAHRLVDAVIDNSRELEDIKAGPVTKAEWTKALEYDG
jgi:hypothetical protein